MEKFLNLINNNDLKYKKILIIVFLGSIVFNTGVCEAATDKKNTESKSKIYKLKKIEKKYRKIIIGEKNIASAMSVISQQEIQKSSSSSSIYSILKLTPSVNEYQTNIGPGAPVFTVRGVRASQLAMTLDDIPLTSLLSGGLGNNTNYTYNVGSQVSMGQISGIHIYPGVAPPDKSGFATVGGTISYTTKKPKNKFYMNIFSKIGSFNTNTYGAEVNSGKIPGTNGLKLLVRWSKTQTDGYIQHTPAQYTDLMFAAVKPYGNGLSNISATVIYNNGSGYFAPPQNAIPVELQNKYGYYYNFPQTETSTFLNNHYLTVIIGDRTYINSHIFLSGKIFYMHKYGRDITQINKNYATESYPYQVNYYAPIFWLGPVGPGTSVSNHFTYNPSSEFGNYGNGETATEYIANTKTIGFVPKINIFLPHNSITIGGLIAREFEPTQGLYIYGSENMPTIQGYNDFGADGTLYGGNTYRNVYSGYLQDKISLFNNRLHIEPGFTYTGVQTSNYVPFNAYSSPNYAYTLSNYGSAFLPYLGISYDATKRIVLYSSYGKGVRFAPSTDYILGPTGSTTLAPNPENVNAYEIGGRYVGRNLYLNIDGYLQDMKNLFSYEANFVTGFGQYENLGQEEMKGIELSTEYKLDRNFSIVGSASYNSSKYINTFPAVISPNGGGAFGYALAGSQLPGISNWLANLGLNYHNNNLKMSISTSYTGSQSTTTVLDPSVSPPPAVPDSVNRLPSYFLVNLNGSYKIQINNNYLKSIDVSLNIDNLFNRQYLVHYYQNYKQYAGSAVGPLYASEFPGMPRFIEIGINGHFE